MPRKQTTRKSSTKIETEVTADHVAAKAPKTKRTTKKEVQMEEALPQVEEAPPQEELVEEISDVENVSSASDKKRRVPTRDSVLESFDELITTIDDEIARLRESPQKTKGVKFLRTVNKNLKTIRSQSTRVMKHRNRSNRKNNNNSGFLKPVQISKEMAKFTGWDTSELRSRVDVTKFICNYIKENNLQNPADRRQIVADNKLAKLLDYDSKKTNEPLTYYRIQSYMKKHFIPPPQA